MLKWLYWFQRGEYRNIKKMWKQRYKEIIDSK
jgi:hypothetical protein